MSRLTTPDYHIGWICALNKEMTAAISMLDEEHEMIAGQDLQDHNSYVLGRIHQHNVVIACMPEGVDGLVPAATVAKDMARKFPALRIALAQRFEGRHPRLHATALHLPHSHGADIDAEALHVSTLLEVYEHRAVAAAHVEHAGSELDVGGDDLEARL